MITPIHWKNTLSIPNTLIFNLNYINKTNSNHAFLTYFPNGLNITFSYNVYVLFKYLDVRIRCQFCVLDRSLSSRNLIYIII